MKTAVTAFLCSLFFVVCSTQASAQGGEGKLRQIVESINKTSIEAFMKKDLDALLNLYTDDAVAMPNFSSTLKGKESLKKHFNSAFSMGMDITQWESDIMEIWKKGDQIFVISSYKMEMSAPGAEPMEDVGKGFAVLQKVGKDYKVKVEIWNTDLNPWAQQ